MNTFDEIDSMPGAEKILPHYTYREYEKWTDQWELIDGIPYAMSPLPVAKHQRIATRLTAQFFNQLENCQTCSVYQPLDYRVSDDTILQPDMLVVCNEIIKNYLDFPPALVVEILSPSTALKDRHTKYSIYEAQGIQYYVIVAPEPEEVEVYSLENGVYELKGKSHNLQYNFEFKGCLAQINFEKIW